MIIELGVDASAAGEPGFTGVGAPLAFHLRLGALRAAWFRTATRDPERHLIKRANIYLFVLLK